MSNIAKQEVHNIISAMDIEEQRIAAERLDDEVLFDEVSRRVGKLEGRVGGMIQFVTNEEQNIGASEILQDLGKIYIVLCNMYSNMRSILLGKKNDR